MAVNLFFLTVVLVFYGAVLVFYGAYPIIKDGAELYAVFSVVLTGVLGFWASLIIKKRAP